MNKKRVVAVIVTFNRCRNLKVLLGQLINQNYELDSLLIFDNASSDNTVEYLQNIGIAPKHEVISKKLYKGMYNGITTYFLENSFNSGGAGGFHDAIKIASDIEGIDYVWVMDDDVFPDENCLHNLLAEIEKDKSVGIAIPNRTGNGYVDRAIIHYDLEKFWVHRFGKLKKSIPADDLDSNITRVADMPFEGPLIKKSLIKKVGLPKKEFFLIYDDTEYATRCLQYGDIIFVKNASLKRQIVPQNTSTKKTRRVMTWKEYYTFRNEIFFERKYGKNWAVRNIRNIIWVVDLTLRAIVLRKWGNLKIIRRAYLDGIRGTLGKNDDIHK